MEEEGRVEEEQVSSRLHKETLVPLFRYCAV